MPTQPYFNSKGEKLPSVSQILGNLGWKGFGLMIWAHQLGKDGKDLFGERNKLADAGSLCHAMAAADVTGQPPPNLDAHTPEMAEKVRNSFKGYLQWKEATKIRLVASEVSIVSEDLGYGGTLDAIGVIDGICTLVDFKSSKELYGDHIVQLAAYRALWNSTHPDLAIQQSHILRWNPEATFSHHMISDGAMEAGWEVFKCCLTIHRLKKLVKP